jgi:hypothetical protein
LIGWIIRQQNDHANLEDHANLVDPFLHVVDKLQDPLRSSRSRVGSPRSHSLIFTGLWLVRRGRPGI